MGDTLVRQALALLVRLVMPLLYLNIVPDRLVRMAIRLFLQTGLTGSTTGVYRVGRRWKEKEKQRRKERRLGGGG